MDIMSNLRILFREDQDGYIGALITAGMPPLEAVYFNALLEKEGIRRMTAPHLWDMVRY